SCFLLRRVRTLLAQSGDVEPSSRRPLSGANRKTYALFEPSAKVPSRFHGGKKRHARKMRATQSLRATSLPRPASASPVLRQRSGPRLLILGVGPMHLLAEMRDETAARHGDHIVFVDFVAGCDPPRALDHGDEAIVGMEMRLAEVAGLESIEDDVGPALGRIALQHDLVGAGGT